MDTSPIEFGEHELGVWLRDKPDEWSRAIAARMALRVLPLVFRIVETDAELADQKRVVLAVHRAAFIAWVGALHFRFLQGPDTLALGDHRAFSVPASAAEAIVRRIAANATPIAQVASAAYHAAGAAYLPGEEAAGAAAAALEVADSISEGPELRVSVAADVDWLRSRQSERLIAQPLWLNEVRGSQDYVTNFPPWARAPLDSFSRSEWVRSGPWGVWPRWYRAILPNRPNARPSTAFGERFDIEIATKDDLFWQRDPDVVTGDIAALAGHRWDGQRATSSTSKAEPPQKNVSDEELVGDTQASETPSQVFESPPQRETRTKFRSDAPDGTVDYLNRSRLAFILAARLNRMWDSMQPSSDETPPPDERIVGDRLRPGFVVHIDAPWGGGKTTFAEHLARILNPYRYPGPLPRWLQSLPLSNGIDWPEEFRRPWHIVSFNAWRNQHVNPPWWVFSESIRQQCLAAQLNEKNRQKNTLPEPLRKFGYRNYLVRRYQWGREWIRELWWRLNTPEFISNLILAVIIIATFYILLKFDILNINGSSMILNENQNPIFASLFAPILFGIPALLAIYSAVTKTLIPGTPEAARNYSLGSGDPLARFRRHFAETIQRLGRPVLVIVDDLDRCEPAYITELVRGMQTILVSPNVIFLLLGDRDWIEQAFSETHQGMKGIYVGPEHDFGARFVEKAIQLSFVIPALTRDHQKSFVRRVLELSEPSGGEEVLSSSLHGPAFKDGLAKQTEDVLSLTDYADREHAADDLRSGIRGSGKAGEEALRTLEIRLALRAAADPSARRATRHMLEPLAPLLPPNPRQIKRIVNTLSLMQEAARLERGIEPWSKEWQALARWVIIVTEWPKSGHTLCRYPGLANKVLERDMAKGDLPVEDVEAYVEAIRANKEVVALLKFMEPGSGWRENEIDADQIEWLKQVMPAASARPLTPIVSRKENRQG